MKVVVTGSTGFIGSTLISFLEKEENEIYKLVRVRANLLANEIAWDPQRGVINPLLLEGLDVVVHLAGENIMGRWSESKKERIRSSRVKGTQLLCQALCQLQRPPSLLICASAIGYYGSRGDEILTEQSSKGEGFLADVCEEWEESTRLAVEKGIRVINLRLGMVLSPKGGGLKQILPIFKWGLGGKMGLGYQYVSWIAIDDLMRVIEYVIHREDLAGPLNAVSPNPVTNAELTQVLGGIVNRPTFFSMPAFMVKLLFGQMGEEVLLSSERVKPEKLEKSGFQFKYPNATTHVTDAKAFIGWLDQQPSVAKNRKMGTQGYCMGGAIAFRTAYAVPDRVGAVASFHGGNGLVTANPDSPHLEAAMTKAQFLVAIAQNDDMQAPTEKTVMMETFAKAGLPAEVEVYPAMHGWCPPDSGVYSEPNAEKAWSRLLVLYGKALA